MPPPLGRQDSVIRVELYTKVRHAPPPLCNLGRKFEDRISVKTLILGPKNRTKFE